jgi:molecular chaperone DnaK (HSP70)
MAKIVIVSFSKTKLKIQFSPKLTKNQFKWLVLAQFHRNIQNTDKTLTEVSLQQNGVNKV